MQYFLVRPNRKFEHDRSWEKKDYTLFYRLLIPPTVIPVEENATSGRQRVIKCYAWAQILRAIRWLSVYVFRRTPVSNNETKGHGGVGAVWEDKRWISSVKNSVIGVKAVLNHSSRVL